MTMERIILAGMGAGFGSAVVLTPVELIKCRLQVRNFFEKANVHFLILIFQD